MKQAQTMPKVPRHPNHPDYVIGYRGPKGQLAKRIVEKDMVDVANFINELGLDIIEQGVDDDKQGRRKLGTQLLFAGCYFMRAQLEVAAAAKEFNTNEEPRWHPLIKGYCGPARRLAHNVGRMRFDSVATFTNQLSAALRLEAQRCTSDFDKEFGRHLNCAIRYLKLAEACLRNAWEICEPHMA